jgi:hypothetical protein
MSKLVTREVQPRTTKPLNIGRAWINKVSEGSRGPALSIQMDRNLSADITLSPGDRVYLWPNKKREGIRDADFRLSMDVPTALADEIIERQRGNI